jgi:O-antigen ligase
LNDFGESFPHPHNAYFEWALDNGILLLFLLLWFYLQTWFRAYSLFKDSRNITFVVAGGAALALISALGIAAFGSQTFYPREGALGMWCMIGLMLRVWVQRNSAISNLENERSTLKITNDQLWSPSPSKIAPSKVM